MMQKAFIPLLVATLVAMCFFPAPAEAGSGRKPFRVKVRRIKRGKTPPGGTTMVRLKVKNRTREEQDVIVNLFRKDHDVEPFATREIHLEPKEKVRLEIECPVPTDIVTRRLRVRAELQDDGDDNGEHDEAKDDDETSVPVTPPATDVEWLQGRDLYQANCLGCHSFGDHELREEGLGDWLETVRRGEDDMPAFPTLTKADVQAMRKYFFDPERVVEEPGPTTPPPPPPATITYENTVKAILDVSCVACHRSGNAFGGVAADTYASAFANRTAIVDSVEKNRMPTSTPLSADKKTALRAWLDGGAPEK